MPEEETEGLGNETKPVFTVVWDDAIVAGHDAGAWAEADWFVNYLTWRVENGANSMTA